MKTIIGTMVGDITNLHNITAIVNPSNNSLSMSGGLNGIIHNAAGPSLAVECSKLGGCKTGDAKLTHAYKLPYKCIIHTVGPVWQGGKKNESKLLYSCYYRSLKIAANHGIRTIAFPSISTGKFGYPIREAAATAVEAAFQFCKDHPNVIDKIIWVLIDRESQKVYDNQINLCNIAMSLPQPSNLKINVIGFHLPTEPYGILSNWYPAKFQYAGNWYNCVEQYMMYQKVMLGKRYDLAQKIMGTSDPATMKELAGKKYFPEFMQIKPVWDKICFNVVKRGVKEKFRQNHILLKQLSSTGTSILAECAAHDHVWGIGINLHDPAWKDDRNWNGKNYLGKILMEVRSELQEETHLHILKYQDYRDADAIPEWDIKVSLLEKDPRYTLALQTYSEQLPEGHVRDSFYEASLLGIDIDMRMNMGGGLPIQGFYELKQEIYEIARIIKAKEYPY